MRERARGGAEVASEERTLREAARELSRALSAAGVPSATLDARVLVAEACGLTPAQAIAESTRRLSAGEAIRLRGFAARRLSGEPVSRIVGRREFFGLTFRLSPHTLDPRPETELLVEAVLDHARSNGLAGGRLRILDLGTGTGCILAALLTELPHSIGVGIDKSEQALVTARQNLAALGLLDRCALLCMDWGSGLKEASVDIVVSNPPYISSDELRWLEPEVAAFDPRLALDGGSGGYEAYRALIPEVARLLSPGGFVAIETGQDQAATVADMMMEPGSKLGFMRLRIIKDLAGIGRAVAGLRQL